MFVECMETMPWEMDVAELNKTYLCDLISLKNMWFPFLRMSFLAVQLNSTIQSQMHLHACYVERTLKKKRQIQPKVECEWFYAVKRNVHAINTLS